MIGTFPVDKIRKLIPRLASDHDGEVLGAVGRALMRDSRGRPSGPLGTALDIITVESAK
jgi:hypothetical protein